MHQPLSACNRPRSHHDVLLPLARTHRRGNARSSAWRLGLGHVDDDLPALRQAVAFLHGVQPSGDRAIGRIGKRAARNAAAGSPRRFRHRGSPLPAVRGIDHLVAEIDGHVQVRRIPFAQAEIPPQADRLGVADEVGPELSCELAGPLGMDRSERVECLGGQRDDSDRGEQRQDRRRRARQSAPRIAESASKAAAPEAGQQADARHEVLHDPRGRSVGHAAVGVASDRRGRERQPERRQAGQHDHLPALGTTARRRPRRTATRSGCSLLFSPPQG